MQIPKIKLSKRDPKIYALGLVIVCSVLMWFLHKIPLPMDSIDQNYWLAFINQIATLRWISILVIVGVIFWSLRWLYKFIAVGVVILAFIITFFINPYLPLLLIFPYETFIEAIEWPVTIKRYPSPDGKAEAVLYRVADLTIPYNPDPRLYVVSIQSLNAPRHILYQSHFWGSTSVKEIPGPCDFIPDVNWIDNQTIRIVQAKTDLYEYTPDKLGTFPMGYDECIRGKRLSRITFNVHEPTQTFCCVSPNE